jgi:hypothetical protein
LYGIACKHILRVMQACQRSPSIAMYMQKQLEAARKTIEQKTSITEKQRLKTLAKRMKDEHWDQRKIQTTKEKREKRQASPSYQRMMEKAKSKAQQKALEKLNAKSNKEAALKTMLAQAERVMKTIPGLTDQAIKAALKAQEKELRKGLK